MNKIPLSKANQAYLSSPIQISKHHFQHLLPVRFIYMLSTFSLLTFLHAGCQQTAGMSKDEALAQAQEALDTGDYEEALRLCNQHLSKGLSLDWIHMRGNCYLYLNQFQKAFEDFEAEYEFRITEHVYTGMCHSLFRLGRYEEAMNYCEKAIQIDPKLPDPYSYIGWIHFEQGDWANATSNFEKALKVDQKNSYAHSSRAAVKIMQEDWQGALEDCEKAIEYNDRNADGFMHRAMLMYSMGQNEEALLSLETAQTLAPFAASVYHNFGLVYEALGDIDIALSNFNRCLELNPRYYKSYINRGMIYLQNGEPEKAVEDFQVHLTQFPDDGFVWYLSGLAKIQMDGIDPCDDLKKALALGEVDAQELIASACMGND